MPGEGETLDRQQMPRLDGSRVLQLAWGGYTSRMSREPRRRAHSPGGSRLCDLCSSRYLGDRGDGRGSRCGGGRACPRSWGCRRRDVEWHDGYWVPLAMADKWEAEDRRAQHLHHLHQPSGVSGHAPHPKGPPVRPALEGGHGAAGSSIFSSMMAAVRVPPDREQVHEGGASFGREEVVEKARPGPGSAGSERAWCPPGAADYAISFKPPPTMKQFDDYQRRCDEASQLHVRALGKAAPGPFVGGGAAAVAAGTVVYRCGRRPPAKAPPSLQAGGSSSSAAPATVPTAMATAPVSPKAGPAVMMAPPCSGFSFASASQRCSASESSQSSPEMKAGGGDEVFRQQMRSILEQDSQRAEALADGWEVASDAGEEGSVKSGAAAEHNKKGGEGDADAGGSGGQGE